MFTVQGPDISIWQDDNSTPQQVDFQVMREAGAKFVFIKVSQAVRLDQDYTYNWRNAQLAGIPRGGYHYLDWSQPVLAQAQFFAGVLHADPGELPPVIDFEERYNIPVGAAGQLKTFCDEFFRLTGKQVMIYTSMGMWNAYGNTQAHWLLHKLWLARYTTITPMPLPPWTAWTFWQYTSAGNGPHWGGEEQYIDLNWYRGTETEFYNEFGLIPPGPTDAEKLRRLWEAHPELQ